MNQLTENKGRQDAKLKEKKELDLISTERVSFSDWARWMAFHSGSVEVEDTDFIFFPTSPLFQLGKTYRNAAIMVYFKIGEEEHALKKGFRNLDFIRTGKDAGIEGKSPYVVTSEGHVGYEVIVNPAYDELKGPDIVGNEPMKDSCIDRIKMQDGDFVIMAGKRLRPGDFCFSDDVGVFDNVKNLLKKSKRGRQVTIPKYLECKNKTLQVKSSNFIVRNTSLLKGAQMIYTEDGRIGYNVIREGDIGFFLK